MEICRRACGGHLTDVIFHIYLLRQKKTPDFSAVNFADCRFALSFKI